MPDNVTITNGANSTPPAGTVVATDDVGGAQYQRVKLDLGGDGASSPAVGTVPVSGTVAVSGAVPVTDNGGNLSIDDGGNSITVDGTVAVSTLPALVAGSANIGDVDVLSVPSPLSTAGNGTAATAHRVTIASDSTGQVAVASIAAGNNNIGDVDVASSALPTGAATSANQSSELTLVGAVNEAAPASDTASSGLNGRLQRIAQRLTSLIALLPASIGQKNTAGSLSVTLSSDHGAIAVTGGGSGTQYTEGDTDATITGSVVMWEDAADTIRAASTAKPLPVDVVSVASSVDVNINGGTVDVIAGTVDVNITGMIPLETSADSDFDLPISAIGLASAARASTAAPTDVSADGDAVSLWATRKGALNIADAGGSITVDNGGTFATQATLQTGANAIGKLAANSGVDIGDVDVTSITPGTAATNLGKAEDAVHNSGDVGVSMLNVRADTPSPTGANGDYVAALQNQSGGAWVSEVADPLGGCSMYRSIDLDETEEEVKAAAGCVYGWYMVNRTTAPIYVKLYNATAATVVVGTTAPVLTLEIPGNSTDHVAANMAFAPGILFSTAITMAATTGIADADTGAPAANACIVNLFYK